MKVWSVYLECGKREERGGEGREVFRCGLTSSNAPEGLTDSTAKYNVLETWTIPAINLNFDHINLLTRVCIKAEILAVGQLL